MRFTKAMLEGYTTGEVARRWDVNRQTIYRWVRFGVRGRKLRAFLFGRTLVFKQAEVFSFEKHLIQEYKVRA